MRNTATLMLALAAALAANSAAFADQPKAPVSPASLGQYSAAAMDRRELARQARQQAPRRPVFFAANRVV